MSKMNEFNANLELQHIYLEAHSERYYSLGQYFEAYYCYRHNLVTRQGKPDWQQLFAFAKGSLKAKACSARKETIKELVLPLSVLTGKIKTLVRDDELTVDAIGKLLDKHLEYVILSRSELQKLHKLGYENRMPPSFYRPDNAEYKNPMSRFNLAEIQF
ncbi:hypothetical protein [Photobacterium lutimaris]|uniref:Uncharacterized protein n=1 Tax=Photobacterium lutimaris TaxID=388278 RepID=A0A2T3J4V6_9GAMM|nr:hypothetical protein [Photobacterium lutimaris]PSU36306.1 hypothetical protein C9I99_04725 [Photobacterium lutimaris]